MLDEMVNVTREMQRLNLKIPLLIGGATTSKAHAAAKSRRLINRATVYVSDASVEVGVAAKLLAPEETYQDYASEISAEYALIKNRVEAQREKRAF